MRSIGLGDVFAVVDGDDAAVRARRLRAFEVIFALVVGTEYWLRAVPKWGLLTPRYYVLMGVATAAVLALLALPRARRGAFAVLAAAHAVLVWSEFPSAGNHAYLELVVCLFAAFLALDDAREAALYLRALRWLAVLILFWSGVQKLAHGYYFHGEYLAFSLASETYRDVLGFLLPQEELRRLTAFRGEVGDGPYAVASVPFVLLSNATWLAEIALAAALCWRRTRAAAVAGALLLLAAIESAAREVFFGLVFADLILLFTWRDRHSLALPVAVALLVVLALVRLGVLPEVTFY